MEKKIVIKERLEALTSQPYNKELEKEFNSIIEEFNAIFNEEKNEEVIIDEDDKEALALYEKNKELNADILKLIQQFKDNKQAYLDAIKAEEEKNAELKKEIINDFKQLVEEEENLGVLFGKIKEIREKWNNIGAVPEKVYRKLQAEYSKLNEDFNYNVNIYKVLQDNDLKKNYSLKNQIIHKVKELKEKDNVKELEKQIRTLQNKWEEIGPTYKEHWEKLKEEYWSNVQSVYDKIKAYYEKQKEEQQANLEKKKALVEKMKTATSGNFENHQDWDKATKEVIAIQAEWKQIGFVPKEYSEDLWKEFRGISNEFFDKKSEFYKERNELYSKNAQLKQELVKKLDAIKDSKEWKKTAETIKKLQNDWKKIGHAGKVNEQKLWKEFRSKCDAFFDARKQYFEQQDEANVENLEKKEALIKEIEAYQPSEDTKEALTQLKEFSKRFAEIGNVPFKEKDRIYKAYKTALDSKYEALQLNKAEKEKALFEAKLETLKASVNPSKTIQAEKEKLRKRINELVKEIGNLENNLGFFSNSKGAESLLKGVHAKIDAGKKNIENLKRQLKMFSKIEQEKAEETAGKKSEKTESK